MTIQAGDIVIADWRDAPPKEPSKARPAVVVEDTDLFDPSYPNVILVPLTDDSRLSIPSLSVAIQPTAENGCTKPTWALAHHVTATSKMRIRETGSKVTPEQLSEIRQRVALSIGVV